MWPKRCGYWLNILCAWNIGTVTWKGGGQLGKAPSYPRTALSARPSSECFACCRRYDSFCSGSLLWHDISWLLPALVRTRAVTIIYPPPQGVFCNWRPFPWNEKENEGHSATFVVTGLYSDFFYHFDNIFPAKRCVLLYVLDRNGSAKIGRGGMMKTSNRRTFS